VNSGEVAFDTLGGKATKCGELFADELLVTDDNDDDNDNDDDDDEEDEETEEEGRKDDDVEDEDEDTDNGDDDVEDEDNNGDEDDDDDKGRDEEEEAEEGESDGEILLFAKDASTNLCPFSESTTDCLSISGKSSALLFLHSGQVHFELKRANSFFSSLG
jgi:hypothetical protein